MISITITSTTINVAVIQSHVSIAFSPFVLFIATCFYEKILIIQGRLIITSPTTKKPIQSPANIFLSPFVFLFVMFFQF